MKKMIRLSALFLISLTIGLQQTKAEPIDTTSYYSFHLNYWFNMHHFLWMEAFLNTKADSSLVSKEFSKEEKAKFDAAIKFYSVTLINEDPRRSDYMTSFKEWVTTKDLDLNPVPPEFEEQVGVLKAFHPIYLEHFWPKHMEACKKMLKNNILLIRATEEKFVEKITKLTRQYWQFDPEKVRVDLSYYAKSTTRSFGNNPYTTAFPTHVVMSVAGQDNVKGNWFELLYHESAHCLILGSSYFVAGTIKDLAETENLELPRALEHAYLFYFTGQLAKELLAEQGIDYSTTYMERGKIFSSYLPHLKKHLTPYMNREITLTEATRRFLADFDN